MPTPVLQLGSEIPWTPHRTPAMDTLPRLTLNGTVYAVVKATEYTLGPAEGFPREVTRQSIVLRRPRGNRLYHAVRYENGAYSSVHALPGRATS